MATETITPYDSQAAAGHAHLCTNPDHGATPRTWACTTPHCIGTYAWARCEVCDPPPSPPPPCTAGCPCPARVTPLQVSVWS